MTADDKFSNERCPVDVVDDQPLNFNFFNLSKVKIHKQFFN